MDKIGNCKMCGAEYVRIAGNHLYCSTECRNVALKIKKERAKEGKYGDNPKITIEQMMDAALRLSEKYGRPVQYGEVQRLLLTGKLKVKGGVIIV